MMIFFLFPVQLLCTWSVMLRCVCELECSVCAMEMKISHVGQKSENIFIFSLFPEEPQWTAPCLWRTDNTAPFVFTMMNPERGSEWTW